jgi:hypothetical protein
MDSLAKGQKLVIKTEVISGEGEDGPFSYDQLYVDISGDQIPIKAADRTGKKLINKYLKSE